MTDPDMAVIERRLAKLVAEALYERDELLPEDGYRLERLGNVIEVRRRDTDALITKLNIGILTDADYWLGQEPGE